MKKPSEISQKKKQVLKDRLFSAFTVVFGLFWVIYGIIKAAPLTVILFGAGFAVAGAIQVIYYIKKYSGVNFDEQYEKVRESGKLDIPFDLNAVIEAKKARAQNAVCPHCGARIPAGAKKCFICGDDLK